MFTEQDGSYKVILERVGQNIIMTIKEVREATGLGLKEAKDLVDNAPQTMHRDVVSAHKPQVVKGNLSMSEAEVLKHTLEELGNLVSIQGDLSAPLTQTATYGAGYQVIIEHLGPSKIQTIKVVREYTGLGLKETKDLVEGVLPIIPGLSKDVAARMWCTLSDLGNHVRVLNESGGDVTADLGLVRSHLSMGTPNTKCFNGRCPWCGSTNEIDISRGLFNKIKSMFSAETYKYQCGDCGEKW